MAQRRRCSAQFKTPGVLDWLTGRRSVAPLCREQSLKEQVVTGGGPSFSTGPRVCSARRPSRTDLSNASPNWSAWSAD
jgi:hypothetical protein